MHEPTDWQLLLRFTRAADADAFSQLVRRHIGFVYAAARRQARDAHLADDITQAVFIVLARKAASIRSESALPGWLFSVTRHAAQNAMKMKARQQFHESRAAADRFERIEPAPGPDEELRAVLDDAIARLPQLEQTGLLMHFFQERSHEEVGAALGLSADAARKRITRGV